MSVYEASLDLWALRQRMIDSALQGDVLAASLPFIGSDDVAAVTVQNTIAESVS
jgi:hypothetical protein